MKPQFLQDLWDNIPEPHRSIFSQIESCQSTPKNPAILDPQGNIVSCSNADVLVWLMNDPNAHHLQRTTKGPHLVSTIFLVHDDRRFQTAVMGPKPELHHHASLEEAFSAHDKIVDNLPFIPYKNRKRKKR